MAVKPVPDGYHSVQPYFIVKGAKGLMAFVKAVFDAEETENMAAPDGTIMHAEARIGNSIIMMSDAREPHQPTTAAVYVYVPDADAAYARAIAAGATSIMEPADQFYGDRHGGVKDQFGNSWWIGTHIEDVPKDELARRAQEMAAKRK